LYRIAVPALQPANYSVISVAARRLIQAIPQKFNPIVAEMLAVNVLIAQRKSVVLDPGH